MYVIQDMRRVQIDRLLDPDNLSIEFDRLVRAATAIGKRL